MIENRNELTDARPKSAATSRFASRLVVFLSASALFVALLPGCMSRFGDSDKAAAPIADPEVDAAVDQAIAEIERRSKLDGKKTPTVCFLGVADPRRLSNAAGLSAGARRRLESGASFRTLEKSAVEAALKESGVRANNVFIPAERKKFVEALGEPVDYLLSATIEKKSDDDDSAAGQNPVFRLELVELSSNNKSEFPAELKRAY